MSIAVIADKDTVTGFRLAGIQNTHTVNDGSDARKTIRELIRESTIIIITEKIAEQIRATIEDIETKKKTTTPIIVEIPDKTGKIERKDPLLKLIKSAVGIEIE